MLNPAGPRPNTRFRLLRWMLVLVAVCFIALVSAPQSSEGACHTGVAEIQVMCELDEQERLPVEITTELPSLTEPESTYAAPPPEGLSDPDRDPRNPPPRRG
jgi:hypothetical protein